MRKGKHELDDLVESVTLYSAVHPLFHGYALPFFALIGAWFYYWTAWQDFWEFYDDGLIGFAGIVCLQLLCLLCCHWSVHVYCFLTCRLESDPSRAPLVKVVPTSNNGSTELVVLHRDKQEESDAAAETWWFTFQKTKYIWEHEKKRFVGLSFPVDKHLDEYLSWKGHQEEEEVAAAGRLYGENRLDMVVPEFLELFKERATAPFFVFQVFCVALWCLDKYWYYSIFTLIMLVLFECTLVQQQLRNMAEIRKMGIRPYNLPVYRNRRWRSLSTERLVPGDLVSIARSQNDNIVPCDLLLLRGSCIVDESMLTGESVLQMKESVEACLGEEAGEARDAAPPLDVDVHGKLHVLYGGTKVVQHSAPGKSASGLRAHDNGCVAYVLRTGFNTSQGKLLRTILFGVKRVTANNLETFGFILFLLVFAVAAAAYVWTKGVADPQRNRYKLFLECTLILTSVVPPELPIELSLAVNTSLLALSKLGVFCTEPFRIPFAGKVNICCFDKTGTLTSDSLVVEGVTGLPALPSKVTPIGQVPAETTQVLATCHSLVHLDDGIVGDPLEKATLTAVDWTLTKGDAVIPKRGRLPGFKIFHRHHFSSALKRMCVVAGHTTQGSGDTQYVTCVKGAPETLRPMFLEVPDYYDRVYLEYARRGARVLALGHRHLGKLSTQELRSLTRQQLERDLTFAGFVVISCPLKANSKHVIREILDSSHRVTMITGDNPLTACYVARQLEFTSRLGPGSMLVLTDDRRHGWRWQSIDETVHLDLDTPVPELLARHDLCITGEGMDHLERTAGGGGAALLDQLLPNVAVFARFAPKQKESVIVRLKALGYVTLMCGDGTNDVGALKHADVGVAILSGAHNERKADRRAASDGSGGAAAAVTPTTATVAASASGTLPIPLAQKNSNSRYYSAKASDGTAGQPQSQLRMLMKELEEQEQLGQVIKLGDASIAAPFTSKVSSIQCICHIVKQGRCTLVTTLQMFKILALNALILAYTQSVLYLDGIKLRDSQVTLQGILLAACFLFISRSKPLRTLSRQRPLPNIFNLYTVLTVFLQFAVHFGALIYLVQQAKLASPPPAPDLGLDADLATAAPVLADRNLDDEDEEDATFQPNLINSTVYVISLALQISTFAINYRGRPYMESLTQNKSLLYTIMLSVAGLLAFTLGLWPDLATYFELIEFPPEFRMVLVQVLFADFFFSFLLDRLCLWCCGEGRINVK